jgi:hypothetical protein
MFWPARQANNNHVDLPLFVLPRERRRGPVRVQQRLVDEIPQGNQRDNALLLAAHEDIPALFCCGIVLESEAQVSCSPGFARPAKDETSAGMAARQRVAGAL